MASNRQQREQREARERLRMYQARQQVHEAKDRRRRRDNVLGVLGGIAVVAIAITAQVVYFTQGPGASEPTPSASADPTPEPAAEENVNAPDASLAEGRTWTGELVFNDAVRLGIELDGAAAPQAVAGWVMDVQEDYYPGTTCHRLSDQMDFSFIQCGSIDGAGGPDPDYSYGPVENVPADGVYPAGTIAMARSSSLYSNGHQFFIVTADTPFPTDAGGYTVVGRVTSGLDDLIGQITSAGVDPATVGADGTGAPSVPTTITSVTLQ
ncbi:peptidylprolyl isomerase [Salinibacterium sp. ZJ70]|uniref:peptidylprolyl isomerase n=1 Tax=Salinibacterium sp. ZJ70 TaxID=2708084 RepID=UPI001CD3E1FC|nr:peptidylprolyl isomerase [Salinibacterium sp. ZJ70]